ncbi:MAG: C/D box methylation guide ribonucleoprotein complex aNOP56 subunit [Candidatus Heimdallarchaeota archaeon]|nr:MAG: C/D box methylation guide ribonucleoprotein complex aNOP56 subunit [Candidatus Heimdallarchaeota archaeon]
MKCVLLVATGILIGEKIEDSSRIIESIWFDEETTVTNENLKDFIDQKGDEIVELLDQTQEEIISDNSHIVDFLRQKGFENARFAVTGELSSFRALITDFIRNTWKMGTSIAVSQLIREKAMHRTRMLLKEKVEARDVYIAQAIKSIDDVNSILNLIYARLSEWYGIHFPELQELVRDNPQYIKLISKTRGAIRSNLDEDLLSHLSDKRRELILQAAKQSLGTEISTYDMNPVSQLARFGVEILKIKDNLETYIEESMKEVAPNIQCLVGSLLGARLIALAGNLEDLAKSSSGTIQVLGAEKALFRHLRSGEDPPKHGVIFQSSYIHSSKKHQRGKIARALAGKLTIAARVDFFSGEFIGTTLLADLEKKVEDIKSSFPEPSEQQLEQKRLQKKRKRKPTFKKGKKDFKGRRKHKKQR